MKAAVIADMFGCPNRCRHCWLSHEKNGRMKIDDYIWITEQFKNYKLNGEKYFNDLKFYSWYREPDYADNYKELWDLDIKLSDSKPERFELASIWRMARDESYAPWLKALGVNAIQVTLFGGEENTDYFTGRKGAYQDILKSFDRMFAADIMPSPQIFMYQTNISDLENIVDLIKNLESKINEKGGQSAVEKYIYNMAGTADDLGAGFELRDIRITREDLKKLPEYFKDKTDIDDLKPEKELVSELVKDDNFRSESYRYPPAFMVSNDFNVYPNDGDISEYANLGNLKTDGIDYIMDRFINRKTLYLKMNYEMPVSYFAKKYGDINSDKLTSRTCLCDKWFTLEGMSSNK